MRGALVLFLTATLACLLVGEGFVRVALKDRFEFPADERSLTYRYDATLGWFPQEATETSFAGSRTVRVRHNALGFRDHEYGPKRKPRIAFLGDSFVWGYDAEESERFTERLQQRLPAFEVLNLGVSGYGTDQEYLLSQGVLRTLAPEVAVLVYSTNDSRDNSSNFRYGAYYKPYYEVAGGTLQLKGVPVPKSLAAQFAAHPRLFRSRLARGLAALFLKPGEPPKSVPDPTRDLLLAERDLLRERGVRFAIALVERRESIERLCSDEGIPLLDLSGAEQYPQVGHWTPEGHANVAERLLFFLRERQWIPPL